jgi:hypothetical protein
LEKTIIPISKLVHMQVKHHTREAETIFEMCKPRIEGGEKVKGQIILLFSAVKKLRERKCNSQLFWVAYPTLLSGSV